MAVLKAIVSLYRAGEKKPKERRKTRVKVTQENKLFSSFQFLGLNEQAQEFGLGSFDLKFYRLTKINRKAENYAISTQQQLKLELPFLLGSNRESELSGKNSAIWIKMDYVCLVYRSLLWIREFSCASLTICSLKTRVRSLRPHPHEEDYKHQR